MITPWQLFRKKLLDMCFYNIKRFSGQISLYIITFRHICPIKCVNPFKQFPNHFSNLDHYMKFWAKWPFSVERNVERKWLASLVKVVLIIASTYKLTERNKKNRIMIPKCSIHGLMTSFLIWRKLKSNQYAFLRVFYDITL